MATEAASQVRAVTLGLAPSFGFGDRIGLATPGHVAAMVRSGAGIEPIFAQQSIREMERTDRSPTDVMHDALHGMVASSWSGGTGADADHLKTTADIDATHAAGYTFYTIDPSDHVDEHADSYDEATLRAKYAAVRDETDWVARYQGREVTCGATIVTFDELACVRCAVKYGRAIRHALMLGDHIRAVNEAAGTDYEIELSVDETEQPTTLAEHYIVAELCIESGMKLVSLAPRYVGDFEKGVDYKGDVAALESSLCRHADIADALGPYKLSLHSGSDKLSMYPAFARASRGRFHVKTAGTSYLEALRVVARHDEALFRRIIDFGRARYDTDKATYHVSATVQGVPPADAIDDATELEHCYLERWDRVPAGKGFTQPGRQILHCTFGSTLRDAELGAAIVAVLHAHPDTYGEVLADHFGAPPGRSARGTELSNVRGAVGRLYMSPALLITVAIQFACQAFKVVYYSIRNRRLELHRLFSTGGMPSAHSAFVSALVVSVGLVEGWSSAAFTVSVVLAAIVVFDAVRLRRTVDTHSRVLRELIALLPDKRPAFDPPVVGHSAAEVVAGMVVGAVLAALAYLVFVA